MNNTFKNLSRILLVSYIFLGAGTVTISAMPAKPGLTTYTQPDGTEISVFHHGDEFGHYFTSADGYLLERNAEGAFHYVVADGNKNIVSDVIARNVSERSAQEVQLVSSLDKEKLLKNALLNQQKTRPRRIHRAPDNELTQDFPTSGIVKGIAVLVEFSDNSFTLEDARQQFDDQVNMRNYSDHGADGSVRDYFTASSNGMFIPEFDVYGPVKLPHPMSYYGADVTRIDDNAHMMLVDACLALDDEVDFSKYDTNNDGMVDNVYIFYAGYGEADGGSANTVWPHSYDLVQEDVTVYCDGVRLNHYACSSELANGKGVTMSGIGPFCHEFSHVLGLPDLYNTVASNEFTVTYWSVMCLGSYNNNCWTPPLHTGYERHVLGWVEPKLLDKPMNVTMNAIGKGTGYRDVYMIPTNLNNEYYILENRQQTGWQRFDPGHGMIVWHIDYNKTYWDSNTVNNKPAHQHVDVVEADAVEDWYTLTSDPFPGESNITSFTDQTTPSMKTWDGVALNSPITDIKESAEGEITFVFMGGVDIFDPVVAQEATNIKADKFTAHWNKVADAQGYLLSVYTKDDKGNLTYIDNYNRLPVGDVDSQEITNLQPLTTYYYVAYATNGTFSSKASNEITVSTDKPTLNFLSVEATAPTNIKTNAFDANWMPLEDAEYYTLTVYSLKLGEPYQAVVDFTDGVEALPSGWSTNCTGTYGMTSYCGESSPSLKMDANEAYIQSPNFNDGIRTLKFWYRGSKAEGNKLHILGYDGAKWNELKTIDNLTNASGGETITLNDIEMTNKAIKIVYKRPETGNVAIDDIVIGYSGDMIYTPLTEYDALNVGNTTKYTVIGLAEKTEYAYDVMAHDSEYSTLQGNRVVLTTKDPSGVENTTADSSIRCYTANGKLVITTSKEAQVVVYDMVGRVLLNRSQAAGTQAYNIDCTGIIIVKVDNAPFKLIL